MRLIPLSIVIGVAVITVTFFPSSSALADGYSCSRADIQLGTCEAASGAINNGGVDLSAGIDASGGGGGGQSDQGGSDGPGANNGDGRAVNNGGGAVGNDPNNPLVFVRDGFIINCTPGTPCDPNLVVSISDIVSFKPSVPIQRMEPDGWMVVGLPTNFYAAASVHVRSGLLLGFPADVRFTPAGYRWDYGDGESLSSRGGGATWAAQDLPEFSETPTSHTFQTSGSHTIVLDVIFTAEYRFAGQPWRGIRGTLAVPTQPLTAVAGDARTVLVERECTLDPSGPGC